ILDGGQDREITPIPWRRHPGFQGVSRGKCCTVLVQEQALQSVRGQVGYRRWPPWQVSRPMTLRSMSPEGASAPQSIRRAEKAKPSSAGDVHPSEVMTDDAALFGPTGYL